MTLIDGKDYFEVRSRWLGWHTLFWRRSRTQSHTAPPPAASLQLTWASLRAHVEPAVGERITWKHEAHLKGRAKLVVGTVTGITSDAVKLSSGASVPYDYLVLAPGNTGSVGKPVHATLAERRAFFVAEAARLKAASSVLIIGGGPVGVELAGEIVTDMPGKKVTLVHSGSALLDSGMAGDAFAGAFANRLTETVKAAGVNVLLGSRVQRNADGTFGTLTDKGADVTADVVYDCTGSKPATAFLKDSHAVKLTADGYIVVEKTLRVPQTTNVFALGDAAATGHMKQGYASRPQAALVVANLLACSSKKGLKNLGAPGGPMMLVSFGRKGGLGMLPMCGGCIAGPGMTAGIKSKELFIDHTRSDHGI